MIIWYTRWAVIHMNMVNNVGYYSDDYMVHKVGCYSHEYGKQCGLLFR